LLRPDGGNGWVSSGTHRGRVYFKTRQEPAADEKAPNPGAVGKSFGQVAERSMAAGCKPAAPCELRGFESSPVHQVREVKSTHRSAFGRWVPSRSRMLRGGSNSVVESQPSKLLVAGSIPVSRSKSCEGQPFQLPNQMMKNAAGGGRYNLLCRCSSVGRARPW
jgi:hypothetical protein